MIEKTISEITTMQANGEEIDTSMLDEDEELLWSSFSYYELSN